MPAYVSPKLEFSPDPLSVSNAARDEVDVTTYAQDAVWSSGKTKDLALPHARARRSRRCERRLRALEILDVDRGFLRLSGEAALDTFLQLRNQGLVAKPLPAAAETKEWHGLRHRASLCGWFRGAVQGIDRCGASQRRPAAWKICPLLGRFARPDRPATRIGCF
jgi:hypothetical protein